jgi:signal transduction histidine kinase/ligand-binding sensor domain-containing protein
MKTEVQIQNTSLCFLHPRGAPCATVPYPSFLLYPLLYRVFPSLLILWLIATTASGQGPGDTPRPSNLHQWGAVTLFHGMPSDHVRAIAQDRDGVMWFGTDGGLVKYDGRRIEKVVTDGPASGRVRSLKFDSSGMLWVGTDAGALRLDGDFKPIGEVGSIQVNAIITPEPGRAVIVCEQGTIFDCTVKDNTLVAVRRVGPEDNSLLTIDAGGRPLPLTSAVVTGGAIIVGTRSRGLLTVARGEAREIQSRPRSFFVEAIEKDDKGRVWYGAQTTAEDSGLYLSEDLMRPEKVGAGTGTVTSLCIDSRGAMWVGTDGRGAFRYRGQHRLDHFTFENTAGGLRSNTIHSVFHDREGVVWFGTDRGACRYDPRSPRAETISDDPDSNFIRTIYQTADGRVWCGTNRGMFFRGASGWQPVKELVGKTIHCLNQDAAGRLLVGTAGGLVAGVRPTGQRDELDQWRFARIENSHTTGGDSIRAICEFEGATYIASYGRGVERLDGTRRVLVWPLESTVGPEHQVVSLHRDKEGKLWIGTAEAGVFTFDGRKVTRYGALNSLTGAGAWAIAGTGERDLWIGTARGLMVKSGDKLLSALEGNDVRGVTASGHAAWCATAGGGLYRVLLDEDAGIVRAQIDSEQGLPSEQAFAVLSSRGDLGQEVLWIGTNRGLASYEPAAVAPTVRVARVMGKRVYSAEEAGAGILLEYPQNSLSIEVTASSTRTFPEQFQYSFSLYDAHNQIVRQRLSRDPQMLMESLSEGRYRVVAKAFTRDLAPSAVVAAEFEVAAAPFPWAILALATLLTLSLAGLGWGYLQNHRLVRTNRRLAETRMQLASETEAERRRIARDLHDQTLADLRRLMLLTDDMPAPASAGGATQINPAALRDEIETISTEIRRICEDLSPSVLANVGLGPALEWALAEAVAHMPAERRFEYQFLCDDHLEDKAPMPSAMQIQVYRIVQEAISNVCRHSGARRVRLLVSVQEHELAIRLEDDGSSFDLKGSRAKTGRGLTNIRSRASLIDAQVGWEASRGGGTCFTLRKSVSPPVSV